MRAWLLASVVGLTSMHQAQASVVFDFAGATFNNLSGSPAGTLTGSFTTTDDLSTILAFDIVASRSGNYPGFDYSSATSTATVVVPEQTFLFQGPFEDQLQVAFAAPLAATGTTMLDPTSFEAEFPAGSRRLAGSVVSETAIPEPATLALLALGAAGAVATSLSPRPARQRA